MNHFLYLSVYCVYLESLIGWNYENRRIILNIMPKECMGRNNSMTMLCWGENLVSEQCWWGELAGAQCSISVSDEDKDTSQPRPISSDNRWYIAFLERLYLGTLYFHLTGSDWVWINVWKNVSVSLEASPFYILCKTPHLLFLIPIKLVNEENPLIMIFKSYSVQYVLSYQSPTIFAG